MGIANIHRVRHLQTKTAPSQAWEAGSIPVFRSTLKKTFSERETFRNQALTRPPPLLCLIIVVVVIFTVIYYYFPIFTEKL